MPCSAKCRPILTDKVPQRVTAIAALVTILCAVAPAPVFGQTSGATSSSTTTYTPPKTPAEQLYDALRSARAQVKANPTDAKAHYQLGVLLKKAGRKREAAQEFLDATEIDPTMYVAFHDLSVCSDDQQLIEEAIHRLEKAKESRPKEVMLRVALSELLEKKESYSQAARVLIDLQYANGIPPKYTAKINARIHYLLAKSKEAQLADKQAVPTDDELDVVPAPLPDTGLRKGLTASKIKESREMKGMGHVPLLP